MNKTRAKESAEISAKFGLKGMDAIVVQAAKENNSFLVSLDEEMIKVSSKAVKTMPVEKL